MRKNLFHIKVSLDKRSYKIHIGDGQTEELFDIIKSFNLRRQVAIITTPPVSKLYLQDILHTFDKSWTVNCFEVPDGESSKSTEMAFSIYSWLIEKQYERNCLIISLGGGVIGDLAGFVAATYLRGVNLIHVPTTLLAQVDSSVGGKVGVNHPLGKNLIGAFYQPKTVFCDISFLQSLPEEEYICGLGEIVKYGIIKGDALFTKLENNFEAIMERQNELLVDLVTECLKIKADIVEKDELELGIRAHLNLGHTFAHALEKHFWFKGLKHGQAVLLGIKCALHISTSLQLIHEKPAQRILNLIDKFMINLPQDDRPDPDQLISVMLRDKKVQDGKIRLVLPEDIGRLTILPVTDTKLLKESFSTIM